MGGPVYLGAWTGGTLGPSVVANATALSIGVGVGIIAGVGRLVVTAATGPCAGQLGRACVSRYLGAGCRE